MCFVFLDQTVDAVQQCRRLLDFVNNVSSCPWVRLDNLFDPPRMCNMISKCPVVQQVNQVGIRKCFLSQVDLPVPLGPKIKKLSAGALKNLSVKFFIIPPHLTIAKLTYQIQIESQFYPFRLKIQAIFFKHRVYPGNCLGLYQ